MEYSSILWDPVLKPLEQTAVYSCFVKVTIHSKASVRALVIQLLLLM